MNFNTLLPLLAVLPAILFATPIKQEVVEALAITLLSATTMIVSVAAFGYRKQMKITKSKVQMMTAELTEKGMGQTVLANELARVADDNRNLKGELAQAHEKLQPLLRAEEKRLIKLAGEQAAQKAKQKENVKAKETDERANKAAFAELTGTEDHKGGKIMDTANRRVSSHFNKEATQAPKATPKATDETGKASWIKRPW